MDYHYINNNNNNNTIISNADYLTLVNLLTSQITPEIRKQILLRLTELNDQLILNNNIQNQFQTNQNKQDLSRFPTMNCRKKDVTELQHPSFDMFNYKGNNPLPFSMPTNSNSQFGANMNMMTGYNTGTQMSTPMSPQMSPQIPQAIPNIFSSSNNNFSTDQSDFDLDEILGDIHDHESHADSLDQELDRIKELYGKVIASKRRRRRQQKA